MSNTIYMIKNSITKKVYIGQTIDFERRKSQHINNSKRINTRVYSSIKHHGIDNFDIIPIYSVLDEKDLDDLEIQFIKEYDSFNNGYNMDRGGGGIRGFKHSEETKRKISIGLTNRPVSVETRAKISNSQKGKKRSEKFKKNISIKQKGKNNWHFKGYYHTPFGTLESSYEIYNLTKLIGHNALLKWCKNSDRIINPPNIRRSKYLTDDMLGKTFREIGFWFEPNNLHTLRSQ